MENIKIDVATLTQWHQLPCDQGQSVRVDYAMDWESEYLVRRTSVPGETVEYEYASIDGGEFAPQNGELPDLASDWAPCTV